MASSVSPFYVTHYRGKSNSGKTDEELAELNTQLGPLIIEGRELKLKTLSLDTGTVVVEGELIGIRLPAGRRYRRIGLRIKLSFLPILTHRLGVFSQ